MKAFLQRWYVINQLYHYLHKRGLEFDMTNAGEFTRWVIGKDLKRTPSHWYNYTPPKGKARMFGNQVFWWIFINNPKDNRLRREKVSLDYRLGKLKETIKKIIRECAKADNNLIDGVAPSSTLELDSQNIGLTERGRDQYALSYLWLRNDYAKKIWTAIIASLVVWYATERIDKAIPQTIKIECVQPIQQITQ